MIYAVTPSGEIISYPTAKYVARGNATGGTHSLYTDKNGIFVADIPVTWAISLTRPYTAPDTSALKAIKKALQAFDSRSGTWNV